MWPQDLIYLLEVLHAVAPGVLIDRIDANGMIYTTNFKRIRLRGFLDCPASEKMDYVRDMVAND